MAAALLFVSSPCPLVRTTCMHRCPTRSRIPSQGHGMGGEAERRLHFRHSPPPPQGKGDAVSRVWALSRQVLPTGRRLAGGSRGLGPWPDPPSLPSARHFCQRRPCAGPSHGRGSVFTMWQHCLLLVAYLHMAAAVSSQCGSTAFKQWCHCLCNAACLGNAAALHPNTAALPVDCSITACGRQQHCCWTVTLPSQ